MQSHRYLNTILTVIAVLLTLNLWALWSAGGAAQPSLMSTAEAAPAGLPDAGAQRMQVVDELKQLNRKVDELAGLFKSGQARVRMEALPKQGK